MQLPAVTLRVRCNSCALMGVRDCADPSAAACALWQRPTRDHARLDSTVRALGEPDHERALAAVREAPLRRDYVREPRPSDVSPRSAGEGR